MTLDSTIFEKDGTEMEMLTITRDTIFRGQHVKPGEVVKASLAEARLLIGGKKAVKGEPPKPAKRGRPKKSATQDETGKD